MEGKYGLKARKIKEPYFSSHYQKVRRVEIMQISKQNQKFNLLFIYNRYENLEILKKSLKKLEAFNYNFILYEAKVDSAERINLNNFDFCIYSDFQLELSQLHKYFENIRNLKKKSVIFIGEPQPIENLNTLFRLGVDNYLQQDISINSLSKAILNCIQSSNLKKQTRKLEFSQEKFRNLFNNLNDSVIFHDLKGNIIEVNDTACQRLNYSYEELIKKNLISIDSPNFRKFIKDRIGELKKRGNLIFESEHITKGGKVIPVEISTTLVSYEREEAILSIARDISLRKKKEKKYQKTLQQYKQLHREMELILDHIPGLVYHKDTKNNFLRVNKNLAEAHGMTKEEMSGKSCFKIFPEEQAQAYWEDDLDVIKSGKPKLFIEEKWQTPEGLRWTSTSKIPLKDEEGIIKGIIGFSIDLTEKKLIEKELIKSQKELKVRNKISNLFLRYQDETLYNKILDYLFEIFESEIGYFSYINSEGDLVSPTMKGGMWERCSVADKDFIFPKDSWGGLWGRSLKESRILTSEGPFNLPQGHIKLKNVVCIPIIFQNEIIGQMTLGNKKGGYDGNDIDLLKTISNKIAPILDLRLKRKQQEKRKKKIQEKLRESEQKYRSVLENIKEGYFETDLRGNFTFFNDALTKILGLQEKEIRGNNLTEYINQKTEEHLSKEFNDISKSKKGKKNIQFRLKKNNEEEIYLETSAYPLYNSDDKMVGYFGLSRDITERKRAELIQKKFQKELEQKVDERTKKLNQALKKQKQYLDHILKASQFKSEFLASMSHELRTPLNAIVGFTDLLLEESFGKLNDKQKDFLSDVKSSSQDLLNMINQVLDISKIEAGQLNLNIKSFSLTNMVNQIDSLLRASLNEKKLRFITKGLDKITSFRADPIKFKEILTNLLSNAIKYTLEGKIELIVEDSGKNWRFKITDTGIGIDKEDYDIIFKEFKRGNSPLINSKRGTGLGLPLSKRLINLHGGEIWFKSKKGEGTTFFFTIPKISEKKKREKKN
ncbi:MAG: PAS domain S-box protein [Candidatus Lokiarchaeota archaeon]|nr:PAS domain S-box protein [Candidatus Lokiarchaeota archaeon]